MEEHVKAILEEQLKETIKNLNSRGFTTYECEKHADVIPLLDTLIQDHTKVANGGSMTLDKIGVLNYLKQRNITYLDRYADGLSDEDYERCIRDAFSADSYLMSTSAITRDGCLYNIDGIGNRLSALIFGPKQVIIIVGLNKLTKNLETARTRVQTISAPANAHRLGCHTPCVKTGMCMDCRNKDRICSQEVLTTYQHVPNRIKIIFVKEELGY